MSSPSERLEKLIDKLNLNTRSFAIELGYSRADSIYAIFKRNSKISNSLLNKIYYRFPQVNKDWLLTGHGAIFNTDTASSDDLTVTAKQVIDKLENQAENITSKIKTQTEYTLNTLIVPKMLRHDLVTKADSLLNELGTFLNEFKIIKTEISEMKTDIVKIHGKITSIEFMETIKAIEEQAKKANGGIDLN